MRRKHNMFEFIIDDRLFRFIVIACLWIDELSHIQMECFTIEESRDKAREEKRLLGMSIN